MTEFGALGDTSNGLAINNAGQVVGVSALAQSQNWASLYHGGTMIDLATLGGSFSQALNINNSRIIAGHTSLANGQRWAFSYNNGNVSYLGMPGDTNSFAAAKNDAGDVLGSSSTVQAGNMGFLFSYRTMNDFNHLIDPAIGWSISAARSVNKNGWILAQGQLFGGELRQILLALISMPPLGGVQEPASWVKLIDNFELAGAMQRGRGG